MSKKIWYLAGPFYRYEQDVKQLAREAGVIIIDADVTDSREDAAETVPEVTLKPEYRPAEPVAESGDGGNAEKPGKAGKKAADPQ